LLGARRRARLASTYCRHQPHMVTKPCGLWAQVMCADTGLHAEQGGAASHRPGRVTTSVRHDRAPVDRGRRMRNDSCQYRSVAMVAIDLLISASLAGGRSAAGPLHEATRQRRHSGPVFGICAHQGGGNGLAARAVASVLPPASRAFTVHR
jgi:hypothetical protein